MDLISAAKRYLVLEDLAKKELPYDLALAVFLIRKDLAPHMEFLTREEGALLEEYAKKGEDGRPILTERGSFLFADPERGAEFRGRRDQLYQTEVLQDYKPRKATPPHSISPAELEALDGLIDWRDEG